MTDSTTDTLHRKSLEQRAEGYGDQAQGAWKQFSGRVKEAWGDVTDDDLRQAEGKLDRLVGIIQEKTGEARETVARKLEKLAS